MVFFGTSRGILFGRDPVIYYISSEMRGYKIEPLRIGFGPCYFIACTRGRVTPEKKKRSDAMKRPSIIIR
jgi:hypothetical protein